MSKLYKELTDLPASFDWKDQVTLPGTKENCVGYFYLLTLIDLAAKNPYASLQELYQIGLRKNSFCTKSDSMPPSYSSIYAGIKYSLKDVPATKKPQTLKKYVYQAAMKLQNLPEYQNDPV